MGIMVHTVGDTLVHIMDDDTVVVVIAMRIG